MVPRRDRWPFQTLQQCPGWCPQKVKREKKKEKKKEHVLMPMGQYPSMNTNHTSLKIIINKIELFNMIKLNTQRFEVVPLEIRERRGSRREKRRGRGGMPHLSGNKRMKESVFRRMG